MATLIKKRKGEIKKRVLYGLLKFSDDSFRFFYPKKSNIQLVYCLLKSDRVMRLRRQNSRQTQYWTHQHTTTFIYQSIDY